MNRCEFRGALLREQEPGTHAYHQCHCGRSSRRGSCCDLCLLEQRRLMWPIDAYLATPYSGLDKDFAYGLAEAFAYHFLKQGLVVLSPILHWHSVARRFGLDGSAVTWERVDYAYLGGCAEVYALTAMDYREWPSKGINGEKDLAHKLWIPVTEFTYSEGVFKSEDPVIRVPGTLGPQGGMEHHRQHEDEVPDGVS